MRPSSVTALLLRMKGRWRRIYFLKGRIRSTACSAISSTNTTSIPASFRPATPLPETSGLGSSAGIWTRRIPARMIASVQGGVLPKWLQGSSDTYISAPAQALPAAARASISAWQEPQGPVPPVAMTAPSFTMTAPTGGFGEVRPICLKAIFRAVSMCRLLLSIARRYRTC